MQVQSMDILTILQNQLLCIMYHKDIFIEHTFDRVCINQRPPSPWTCCRNSSRRSITSSCSWKCCCGCCSSLQKKNFRKSNFLKKYTKHSYPKEYSWISCAGYRLISFIVNCSFQCFCRHANNHSTITENEKDLHFGMKISLFIYFSCIFW